MRIPLRPSRLTIRRTKVKWIILHHTIDEYPGAIDAKVDNAKYQMKSIYNQVLEQTVSYTHLTLPTSDLV